MQPIRVNFGWLWRLNRGHGYHISLNFRWAIAPAGHQRRLTDCDVVMKGLPHPGGLQAVKRRSLHSCSFDRGRNTGNAAALRPRWHAGFADQVPLWQALFFASAS